MTTFVLVPGGWHGGWCYKRVTELLRAQGHSVYPLTLTGIGERAHLLTPGVTLDTHIEDVLAVMRWENLSDVVLVGHSYGGMVISGVADRAPERIKAVVYFDALWPENGERTADVTTMETAMHVLALHADPENPPIIIYAEPSTRMLGVTDDEDVAWVASKLTPQPEGAMLHPLALSQPNGHLPTIYIVCSAWEPGVTLQVSYERAKAAAATNPNVRVVVLDAPHNAMVTHPHELTELLLDI